MPIRCERASSTRRNGATGSWPSRPNSSGKAKPRLSSRARPEAWPRPWPDGDAERAAEIGDRASWARPQSGCGVLGCAWRPPGASSAWVASASYRGSTCDRDAVRDLVRTFAHRRARRIPLALAFLSEALRPASTTAQWASFASAERKKDGSPAPGLALIEAETIQDEAAAIALILREALETKGRRPLS